MQLDHLAGHERVRTHLKRAVQGGTPAHAYLFSGPAGAGKTATAIAFAHDLLDAAGSPAMPGADADDSLRAGAMHPDLWLEDSDEESVSIQTLRLDGRRTSDDGGSEGVPAQSLQHFLSLKGMYSSRRVAILARAERLLETAAAVLLKTIEEPPEGAVLILCAEAVDLLPPTIRSRCQEVEFQRLPDATVERFLLDRGLPADPAVLRLANGAPGVALRLAENPDEVARRRRWEEMLEGMVGRTWLDVVASGSAFAAGDPRANRAAGREALEVWEAWLRDFAVSRAGAAELARRPQGVEARNVWAGVTEADALRLWGSARQASERVRRNVNPRLAVEVFLADVAFAPGPAVETRS